MRADRGRVRARCPRVRTGRRRAHDRLRDHGAQGAGRLPRAGRRLLHRGTAIAVSDEELLAEQGNLARAEGTFVCPEGAACFAAVRKLRGSGWLSADDEVVVLNTGAGVKYPETVEVSAPVLAKDGAIPRQGR
ncbi:pyridoxal-phosphate dependent enzyme [Amycolatopsis thermoflava]|uniref:pyridoxal-phosphate dependent enzyme n=1 Tax=Amycolatopsis thermoflava TaxID=84480 RepID=UPI003D743F53